MIISGMPNLLLHFSISGQHWNPIEQFEKAVFDDDWWVYSPLHIDNCHIFLWSLQEGCPQFQAGLQHHLVADIADIS